MFDIKTKTNKRGNTIAASLSKINTNKRPTNFIQPNNNSEG